MSVGQVRTGKRTGIAGEARTAEPGVSGGSKSSGLRPEVVRRITLAEQIADRLRDMVLNGVLKPGSRVVEGEVGHTLGVSRTPLREALKMLAGEGLIDIVPARGAVVHRISKEQARHLLEVVTGLEAIAAPLSCQRATDRQIRGVRMLHDLLEGSFARKEWPGYYRTNLEIHAAIVKLSGNPELVALHARHSARLKLIRFTGASRPDRWLSAMEEHRAMMAALTARDGALLASILANHFLLIWERVTSHE